MTKTELAATVAAKAQITKKQADLILNTTFDAIKQALVEGDKVQLIGFGTFEIRNRAARKGRNPQTNEEIDIPASKLPSFKAGKALKEAVNP
ncbi:MAG: HU family DNA-binding protein [Selenomonadaceae bacterium]|nr:HU family DNA-binding protein [Selenomonadaceae bacterium]